MAWFGLAQRKKERARASSLVNVVVEPGTIRGVWSSHVKGGFGQLLASSHGSQATYDLSIPTETIDEFISHSWCRHAAMKGIDPIYGRLKWLSICLHQNGEAALVASIAAGAALAVAEAVLGWHALPLVSHCWFDGEIRRVSFAPYVVGYVTFLTVLLFGLNFLPTQWLRSFSLRLLPDRLMFLDKVCIHQTDPQKNQAGIRAINEFIRRSKKLLVCDNGGEAAGRHYFERLWCVFELAAFVSKEREAGRDEVADSIVVLPLLRPVCLLIIQLGLVLVHIYDYLVILRAGGDLTCEDSYSFTVNFFVTCTLTMTIPFWIELNEMVQKDKLLHELRTFRFEDVDCYEASDRESIRNAIEEFYKDDKSSSSSPPTQPTTKSGVDRFDEDVQSGRVYRAVEYAMGKHVGVLARSHIAMACLPNLFRAFAYFPGNIEVQPRLFLFHGVFLVLLFPAVREGCLQVYRAVLHRNSWKGIHHIHFFLHRTAASIFLSTLFSGVYLALCSPAVYMLGLKSEAKAL